MKIHEYQGKEILRKYGVAVPNGEMATTLEEADTAAKQLVLGRELGGGGEGADSCWRAREGWRGKAGEIAGGGGCGVEGNFGDAAGDAPDGAAWAEGAAAAD